MPGLRLITAPAVEPITLVEARLHLRIDAAGSPPIHADDTLVTALIKTARNYLDGREGRLGRALITQTWELVLDKFPVNEMRIPLPPLQSVTSVKYDPPSGGEQTVLSSNYIVDAVSSPGWIVPVTGFAWPATMDTINAVRVRFVSGYGDEASDLPDPIKQAMLLMLGHLYDNRGDEEMPGFPPAIDALLSPYEVVTIT